MKIFVCIGMKNNKLISVRLFYNVDDAKEYMERTDSDITWYNGWRGIY